MKILWRRSTETENTFGERRSPRCRAPHGVHTTLRVHGVRGFLARCECERGYVRGCERTGFSPDVSASARASRQARYKQNRWYMVYQWFFAYGTMKVSAQIASYGHPSDPKPTQLCAWGWLL